MAIFFFACAQKKVCMLVIPGPAPFHKMVPPSSGIQRHLQGV